MGMSSWAVLVGAEEAHADAAVGLAGEGHAVALEVFDAAPGALGHDLDRVRVGEEVALLDGVGGVLLPGVLLVHRAEGGVDAAGREGGVGVVPGALADGEHVDAPLGELDGGAESAASGADDEHGGGDAALGRGVGGAALR
jgi:hypothetical protein